MRTPLEEELSSSSRALSYVALALALQAACVQAAAAALRCLEDTPAWGATWECVAALPSTRWRGWLVDYMLPHVVSLYLPLVRHATLPPCCHAALLPCCPALYLPLVRHATLPPCYHAALLPCCPALYLPLVRSATLLPRHPAAPRGLALPPARAPRYPATLPPCHPATLLPATLPPCYPAQLPLALPGFVTLAKAFGATYLITVLTGMPLPTRRPSHGASPPGLDGSASRGVWARLCEAVGAEGYGDRRFWDASAAFEAELGSAGLVGQRGPEVSWVAG